MALTERDLERLRRQSRKIGPKPADGWIRRRPFGWSGRRREELTGLEAIYATYAEDGEVPQWVRQKSRRRPQKGRR